MTDTQVLDLQFLINKNLCLNRDCLRKIVAHQALYVRLQQSAADIDGSLSRGAKAVGRFAEGVGASENMDTMREVTEKLASLTLVDIVMCKRFVAWPISTPLNRFFLLFRSRANYSHS
jgi:hypothetical protein